MSSDNDALLGRIAVHTKLLTPAQLEEATDEQGRSGGRLRLGEILVEKGFVSAAQLQKLLVAQKQVLAKQAAKRGEQVAAAVQPEPEPGAVASPRPAPAAPPATEPVPRAPASAPAPAAAAAPRAASAPRPAAAAPVASGDPRQALHEILRQGVAAGVSDVHLHGGAPLRWRRHGVLETQGSEPLDAARGEAMLRAALSPEQQAALDAEGQIDLSYTLAGVGRFRVNVYRQQRGLDGVFRIVPDHPPSLEELGLPNALARLTNYHQGMVLVTGPAGCGKSSTMAAFLNLVNGERTDHILTIEDPIEVVHPSRRCLVNQRQVRTHTETFARALRAALREDPDVIAIGELRDLETISLALTAAETGHFVLGTLHTNSTVRTIDRLIGVFPPDQQSQVRTMLSESLRAVVSQRLVRRADGQGRVPALEVLVVNKAVSNLIRENKTFQIRSILQTGASQGMCLLDSSLEELVKSGAITKEEARRHCEEAKRFGGAGGQ
jgi:twitching motility protein PilT